MKNILKLCTVIFASFLLLTGCRTAALNSINTPVDKTSAENVYSAIRSAGISLGWKITKVSEGMVVGELALRGHVAVVEIPYNASEYSILYKDSSNLKYDAENQTIHSNYNGWVQKLDRVIKANLASMDYTAVNSTPQAPSTETKQEETSQKVNSSNSDWR